MKIPATIITLTFLGVFNPVSGATSEIGDARQNRFCSFAKRHNFCPPKCYHDTFTSENEGLGMYQVWGQRPHVCITNRGFFVPMWVVFIIDQPCAPPSTQANCDNHDEQVCKKNGCIFMEGKMKGG